MIGKPCVKCGSKERNVIGRCVPCGETAVAKRKAAKLANNTAWREANSEKARAAIAKWCLANRDKVREMQARYRAANPERKRAYDEKWRSENPDKVKAAVSKWRASNPQKIRVYKQNRQARKAAAGRLSSDIANRLYELQRGMCACCGQPLGSDYHLDHIMPLALGGTNTDDNIQLLRQRCNNQKHAKHPVDFMRQRGFLL